MGLRPVRRARKLCYSKGLQSSCMFFFLYGTRSHPTVKKPAVPRLLSKAFPHFCKHFFIVCLRAYAQFSIVFFTFFDEFGVPEAPGGTPGGIPGPFWHPSRPQRPSGDEFSSILDVILGALGEPGEPFWTTWGASGALFSHFWRHFF